MNYNNNILVKNIWLCSNIIKRGPSLYHPIDSINIPYMYYSNEHTYIHLHIRRNMVATISIVSSKLDDGEAIEICQILIGRYFHWSKYYPICSIFSTELRFISYVLFYKNSVYSRYDLSA